jgi:preprotein translocase subunit SecE
MVRPLAFLQETKDELTKVVWPSRNETIRLTFIVIFISLVVGLYIGGLDFLFTKITEAILK